jgi:hypothetical protein
MLHGLLPFANDEEINERPTRAENPISPLDVDSLQRPILLRQDVAIPFEAFRAYRKAGDSLHILLKYEFQFVSVFEQRRPRPHHALTPRRKTDLIRYNLPRDCDDLTR